MQRPARNALFKKLHPKHVAEFRSMLAESSGAKSDHGVLESVSDASHAPLLHKFNQDWLGNFSGNGQCVLFPTCTQEVARIANYCNAENIAVVPQGGNTGLVYGSTPIHDEVCVSLARMNKTLQVHPRTYSATCDAGVILGELQRQALAHNLVAPLDMGSRDSCTIGGNIATNAGGIHFARYGSLRRNVLGLEAVLADGSVVNNMTALHKDNTGPDLKQLFIGSEGILGIVTRAEVKLYPRPSSNQVAMVRCATFEEVIGLYDRAQHCVGESLSAFEVMDLFSVQLFEKHFKGSVPPELLPPQQQSSSVLRNSVERSERGSNGGFIALIETRGSNADHDLDKLATLLAAPETTSSGGDDGAVLAQSETQVRNLWRIREESPVLQAKLGKVFKFDLSFTTEDFYKSVDFAHELVWEKAGFSPDEVVVAGYGHFGDGNIHINIICLRNNAATGEPVAHYDDNIGRMHSLLYPAMYEFTASSGEHRSVGSISAEHGIGLLKKPYLALCKDQTSLDTMRKLKQALDPKGILNPYKVI